jgi:peroxiredoxin
MRTFVFAIVAVLGSSAISLAGEYNEVLSIGDAAPSWENLPGVDDKQHSLADLKDKPIVVLVFTCNTCPIAVDYEDRIIKFAKDQADQVAVVAINSNSVKDDQLPKMRERAEKKEFPFLYLWDEKGAVAKNYGAIFTPEFFVLNRQRKVIYMGAMDDKSDPGEAKVNYVADAVKAALAGGKPETAETVARGCRIRFPRERR